MPHVTSIGLDVHARSVAAAAFNPFTGEVVRTTAPPGSTAAARRSRAPASRPAGPTPPWRASSPAGSGRSGAGPRGPSSSGGRQPTPAGRARASTHRRREFTASFMGSPRAAPDKRLDSHDRAGRRIEMRWGARTYRADRRHAPERARGY